MPRSHVWRFRPVDWWPYRMVCLLQAVPAAAMAALAWYTGLALVPVLVLVLYVLWTYFGINRPIHQYVLTGGRVAQTDRVYRWANFGFVLQFIVVAAVAGLLLGTTRGVTGRIVGLLAVLFLGAVMTVLWCVQCRALQGPRVPWLLLGTTMVAFPFLLAWLAVSTTWTEWTESLRLAPGGPRGRLERDQPDRVAVATERTDPLRCEDGSRWFVKGEPLRVAVALSGGGYRAAITEAGVLAALDRHCVPIRYLSTVSGGSIIGAYYALGYRPAQFARRLWDGTPGLPNDLLLISTRFGLGASSDADAYAAHFGRVFFGQARLEDLPQIGRHPLTLLVNATDLEAGANARREIFFPGRAPDLDRDTRLADLVAASGAFPGAFGPKVLTWAPAIENPVEPPPVGRAARKFVDGGPVENLGVEGLRHYLTLPDTSVAHRPRPHLLIIVDASRRAGRQTFRSHVSLADLAQRSYEISFDALHEHLYTRYTGQPRFWAWARATPILKQITRVPYTSIDEGLTSGDRSHLVTIVVPVTADELTPHLASLGACRFEEPSAPWWQIWSSAWWESHLRGHRNQPLDSAQHEVAGFDTLAELTPTQVAKGFWVGYAVGSLYWAAIDCARGQLADPAASCEAVTPEPTEICPSVSTLLAMPLQSQARPEK